MVFFSVAKSSQPNVKGLEIHYESLHNCFWLSRSSWCLTLEVEGAAFTCRHMGQCQGETSSWPALTHLLAVACCLFRYVWVKAPVIENHWLVLEIGKRVCFYV